MDWITKQLRFLKNKAMKCINISIFWNNAFLSLQNQEWAIVTSRKYQDYV